MLRRRITPSVPKYSVVLITLALTVISYSPKISRINRLNAALENSISGRSYNVSVTPKQGNATQTDVSGRIYNFSVTQKQGNVTRTDVVVGADCLKARNDTVPASLFEKLPIPYINLGFPKMGTSSIWHYFNCGGMKSFHYYYDQGGRGKKRVRCDTCIQQSHKLGLPPLSKCEKADMYAQIDNGIHFPQIEFLEEIIDAYPNGTFFLTFRNMEKWYHSISHWPPKQNPKLNERWSRLRITGSPKNGNNPEDFNYWNYWYCNHVRRVRELISRNPSQTLVEVDIEDPGLAYRMNEIFGIREGCWGTRNVNAIIHPDSDE
eukprot:CAMPEP_0183748858 /NCGR_PEP_ID=MMETSP0737-20130205/67990_1 /TAXON_ID=385413 /ORGANISM="Thalassiosira miniscula, Strain CCMP1093" /LENGTH=318 /DNA_ID=CAMNT_0025984599 /DNA_START=10 /DNA_END=966 /DNA_ORIENTATION=-